MRRHPIRSKEALQELAMSYALRFPGTADKMRKHLGKKMREAVDANEASLTDARRWVDEVIATLERVRVLDDLAFAEARARTLHRRGRAVKYIERDLSQKRTGDDVAKAAVSTLKDEIEDTDLEAAIILARKKRLGPFGPPLPTEVLARKKARDKQLSTFARSGFSLAVARRVVEAPSIESLT
jgi:regulatory protein